MQIGIMITDCLSQEDLIIASILHGIIEDTAMSSRMILDNFRNNVSNIEIDLNRMNIKNQKILCFNAISVLRLNLVPKIPGLMILRICF